jgi:hypothetical protein
MAFLAFLQLGWGDFGVRQPDARQGLPPEQLF